LHHSHRRRLLLAMDMLGKWALLDLFLMNMMSIAFRFHITAASIKLIPKNLVAVDVKVTPQMGLFTFTTSVALSLVANHVILAFHRNIVSLEDVDDGRRGSNHRGFSSTSPPTARTRLLDQEQDTDLNDMLLEAKYCVTCPEGSWFDAATKEAIENKNTKAIRLALLRISIFDQPFTEGTLPSIFLNKDTRTIRLSIKLFFIAFSMLVLCLILACAVEDTFEFVFTGLAGKLIGIVDRPLMTRRASLISIAKNLGEDKDQGHAFGVFYLQCLYLLFSFIFPLVVLFLAFCMMIMNFTLRQAKILFYTMEIVSAWAALDVFIVSVISAVLEINQFSHFLEGPYCVPLEKYLGVEECFGVETQLLKGCWLIVAASCCFWCLVQFVQRITERAIADREEVIMELVNQ